MTRKNIGILIFDDVEVLDFAGPFEVFSIVNELSGSAATEVYTVARKQAPVLARNGLSVNPSFDLKDAPAADLLIIPGGWGVRKVLEQEDVVDWIGKSAESAERVMSVCTGSLLLAKAGLLKGLRATTHHMVLHQLAEHAPDTEIVSGVRFVDTGSIITSGGISAGIDMSLYVVGLIFGKDMAEQAAELMEYRCE